jgi:hypothetical protein
LRRGVIRWCAVVVVAAAGFAATASAETHATRATKRTLTFHLTEKSLTFAYQDVPPMGAPFQRVSAGDSFEFTSALLTRGGKRAGTIRARCVFLTGGTGDSAASLCQGTFGFAGGTLEAQTTQRGNARVTHIAIIGGTGVYEGDTGSVTSVGSSNGPTHDTFHVILP